MLLQQTPDLPGLKEGPNGKGGCIVLPSPTSTQASHPSVQTSKPQGPRLLYNGPENLVQQNTGNHRRGGSTSSLQAPSTLGPSDKQQKDWGKCPMGSPERREPFRGTQTSEPFKVTGPGRGMHLPTSRTDPVSLSEKTWFLSGGRDLNTHKHTIQGWPFQTHTSLTLRMRPLRVPAKTTVRPW